MLSVFQAGPNETLADILNRLQAAVGHERRNDFFDRFEATLGRLEQSGAPLRPWEQENLLSALGAASVQEYELAIALVAAAADQPAIPAARHVRRQPLSLASLRRRFERLRTA